MSSLNISVIIPAYNEEDAIGKVISEIPKDLANRIIVIDNGSSDNTVANAEKEGAFVVAEPVRGYGSACLRGMSQLAEDTDIVVFLDGDYSDYPEDMRKLTTPIINNEADITIGSRMRGAREKGALLIQAYLGNKLATFLIRLFWGYSYSDLGPFRAVRYKSLKQINMRDKDFGWTVEMQIKAITNKLRIAEIPVRYRKRTGVSKITGTVKGTISAGVKIIYTILKYKISSS